MKFLNLRRKLRNSTLAVMFAVAVMFVMPATAFADDTDVIDNIVTNVEVENSIENNDNIDSVIGSDAELPTVTEGFIDFTEAAEPGITDPFIPNDNCYGICCDVCDENCNGTCCDMCTIVNDAGNIDIPDNFEYGFGNEFAGTDASNEPDNSSEEKDNIGNSNDGIIVDPTDGFINSNENIIPVVPNEPIFPDDYYNNVVVPENPDDIYQPEIGNDLTDDFSGDSDEKIDNGNEEEIIYGDLIGEEEEIISDDDEPVDADNEKSDSSENKSSDVIDEENTDNSDSESSDSTTDDEASDNSDSEISDNTADEENPDNDSEFSDSKIDEEEPNSSDDEASDNSADDADDNTEDKGNEDDSSDSEALKEDDNPVINVVLPVSISVVINPYNLQTANDNDFHYSILSPEYAIKNYSSCDVSIVATVSASTEGGVVLSPYDLIGDETEFTAFVYLETTNESNKYSEKYCNNENQLAFSNDTASKEILTLADGSDGETVGYFRINGQAVLPDNAEYSNQAMLNMVITFDIAPISKAIASDEADSAVESVENVENVENVQELAA